MLRRFTVTNASLRGNSVTNLVRDPDARAPGPENDNARLFQGLIAQVQPGHDGGEGDAPGALDVIVETRHVRAVLVEKTTSLGESP